MLLASIPSPPFNTISLGPLEVHVYGILVATGVAVAFSLTRRRYEARGGDGEQIERLLVRAVVLGFLGARLAYASTHLDRFSGSDWWRVIAIWEGGLALFGGLTVGTLTAVWLARRWRMDLPALMDAAAPAIPAAQAIGRWGNYFNQELFGTPSTLPWAVEIAPANRPAAYADAATFHPTFLYESLYNVLVVVVLLRIERRRELRPGSLLGVYAVLYGIGRFLLELIRTDTTFRFLGLSRNGWVSIGIVVAGLVWVRLRERGEDPLTRADHTMPDGSAARDTGGAGTDAPTTPGVTRDDAPTEVDAPTPEPDDG
jgi:prolipoprotein diacylglyceryl transferase